MMPVGTSSSLPPHGIYWQYFPQQELLSQHQNGKVVIYYPGPTIVRPHPFPGMGNPFLFHFEIYFTLNLTQHECYKLHMHHIET